MKWPRRFALALFLTACGAAPAAACPVCHSATGRQVRAGIFNEEFGRNLLAVLLPFPVILGLAAALHVGFSPRERAPDAAPPDPSTEARPAGEAAP